MNANELMIDDWVMFDHNPVRVAILGAAQECLGLKAGGITFGQPYCMIDPIPLTIEILKKNKFIEDTYIRTKDKFYRHEPNGFRLKVNIDSEGNFYVFDNIIIQCNYVHQLQHAMRISGIEDDFVL